MRFAAGDLAVGGVGRGLETIFQAELQFRSVVGLALAQILLPMPAEVGEQRGCFPEFEVALDPIRGDFATSALTFCPSVFFGAGTRSRGRSGATRGIRHCRRELPASTALGACDWA